MSASTPTPHKAVKDFAVAHPHFAGIVCVLSYQRAGRLGRRGLRRKESRFRIANGVAEAFRPKDATEFHQPVNALIDICGLQLGTHTDPAITIAPDIKTPEQRRDLAQAAWWKGVNERRAQRRLVQAASPVVIIPASGD